MALINFLLLLFIFGFLLIVFIVFRLIWSFRSAAKRFAKQAEEAQKEAQNSYRGRTHTTQTDGTTVIDNREPERAKKKIIPHDEGDYVDFTEE